MVLEHALLSVKPGQDEEFVAAFEQAKMIIAEMPGFLRMTLSKCLERSSTYLLLVEWDRLEDHTGRVRSPPSDRPEHLQRGDAERSHTSRKVSLSSAQVYLWPCPKSDPLPVGQDG